MSQNNADKELEMTIANEIIKDKMKRRDFTKTAAGIGFLSALTIMNIPRSASAWMDEEFAEREDLSDGLKVLVKTYSNNDPYKHKFYDALVKVHLRNLDFAVRKGLVQEHVDHYTNVLNPVIERHIKPAIEGTGNKDFYLWGIFERTSCSYQLYERIDIKKDERTFPCPYKEILENIQKYLGTYQIEWKDVCSKWCIPVWEGFAEKAGVKVKAEPGEICKVMVI